MSDKESEVIINLLNQLHSTEIDRTIYRPSVLAQQQIPSSLLGIAKQSAEARDKIIRALINALEEDSDGGEDIAFRVACDVLGTLKAVEAIDTLVKYIDYQPDRAGTSLYYKPSVKGLIQIGDPAIPKIEQTLEFGKSLLHPSNNQLRFNAVTALTHIGGPKSKDALERAYALESDELVKELLEFAIREIDSAAAEKETSLIRIRPGNIE